MSQRRGLGWGWIPGAIFVAIGIGTSVFLFGECSSSREAIEAYAASVRAGAVVDPRVGGAEAAALTEVLRRTRSVSTSNFIGQAGTECVWTTLELDQGSRSVRFVLAERGDGYEVVAASLTRECDCPIDDDLPCHLE
ncbi:MAG: hypothetical protein R3B82_00075 [Sandaracinaceae bacterium]